jgi:carbamate kinase
MQETIVVFINGEVLANGSGSKISDQRSNARSLAEGLFPILASDLKIVVMHGNKPQVGFVLFRSELASHILHTIPLDVCGADTQGATGYILSQAFNNALRHQEQHRRVVSVLTQTLVDTSNLKTQKQTRTIGPWFDREKAEQYRLARGWVMVEEPGRGYRRAVPCLPALEILEIENIHRLVDAGNIVIAGGGGGIPVVRNADGELEGIEAVIETEQLACMVARELNAHHMLMIVEKDDKFLLSGLSAESLAYLSLEELDGILSAHHATINSRSVQSKLQAASDFLHHGGEQVIVTTLRKLPDTLANRSGLRIGSRKPVVELLG